MPKTKTVELPGYVVWGKHSLAITTIYFSEADALMFMRGYPKSGWTILPATVAVEVPDET